MTTEGVAGSEQLAALGRRLKAAGDPGRGLRRELLAGIRAAAKPLIQDARDVATSTLPKRGGLNERIAKEPMSVRNRLTGSSVGVRIVTTTKDTRNVNRGFIKHPVFARGPRETWKWVNPPQEYDPGKGWFDDTLEKRRPEVTAAVLAAMEMTALKITREGL